MNQSRRGVRQSLGTVGDHLEKWQLTKRLRSALVKLIGADHEKCLIYIRYLDLIENGRPTARAGYFSGARRYVELHSELLREGREQERDETFLHEVAHAVVYFLTRDVGHGAEWKNVMKQLGLPPNRCHNYAYLIERRGTRAAFSYRCQRCQTKINRSRRLPAGRTYTHVRCGGELEPISTENQQPIE